MALRKTSAGKVDKRTKEYKELVERAKVARENRTSAKKRSEGGLLNRMKRLFNL